MFSIFGVSKEKAEKAYNDGKNTGDFNSAIKLYEKLIAKDANDVESIVTLGNIYLSMDDNQGAINAFKQANAVKESGSHWNNLGRAYQQAKNYISAAEAYENAVQLNPDNIQAAYNKAVCLREMGNREDAFQLLLKIIKKNPDHANSHNDLAEHYENKKDLDKVVFHLEKAVQSDPCNIAGRLSLIRVLCEQGNYPESKPHIDIMTQHGYSFEVTDEDGQVSIMADDKLLYAGKA